MSTVPNNIPSTLAKSRPMEVVVMGRIEEVLRYDGTYRTKIITPALDQFSPPQRVLFRSKTRIGSRDEMVTITGRLGGYNRKPFKGVDKETGEVSMVVPVEMTLDLVE